MQSFLCLLNQISPSYLSTLSKLRKTFETVSFCQVYDWDTSSHLNKEFQFLTSVITARHSFHSTLYISQSPEVSSLVWLTCSSSAEASATLDTWSIFNDVKNVNAPSIVWFLSNQRENKDGWLRLTYMCLHCTLGHDLDKNPGKSRCPNSFGRWGIWSVLGSTIMNLSLAPFGASSAP